MNKKEVSKLFKKSYFFNDMLSMHYHFTTSKEEFIAMLSHMGVNDTPENISGRCVRLETEDGSIRIMIGVFNDKTYSTLAHECVHAALYTFDTIGQKLSYDDEILPYLVGYILSECEKRMG